MLIVIPREITKKRTKTIHIFIKETARKIKLYTRK